MALSFKKIFKKDNEQGRSLDSSNEQAVVKQSENSNVVKAETKKKGKHGEPGFCCGSCS